MKERTNANKMLVRNCKRKRDKTQAQMIDIKIDATDNN
jgi:hypothetical protein